ncbi:MULTISPECIES: bifunctional 2-polyprenyl-6-hydroxyphenol methylase/3-demethylubiquinol 3-O-methyltransferase UbiG [unclassified Lactococcus]|uniref:class I SAM-dependent methyltransferase n=1 Tax=unclassified Lactococcus TaxID=2643510 RepID=UPI001E485FE4|nr:MULTISPECIES: class I SAM-dependent methyltransferase [unclassified Lactococcus]
MNEKLKSFYDQHDTPWMQLFYQLVYAQLPDLDGQKILDFGAGFGWTANYLAGKGQHKNQLLALEPNAEMLANHLSENDYEMRMGGLLLLEKLPDATFDFIVCHNVLEYCPDERSKILSELTRVLKKVGHCQSLSIILQVQSCNALFLKMHLMKHMICSREAKSITLVLERLIIMI